MTLDPKQLVSQRRGRAFYREVEEETKEARGKFLMAPQNLDRDMLNKVYWISCIVEEVGKLSRTCNKMAIASTPDVHREWSREGRHRLLTISSLVRRMAEAWHALPDRDPDACGKKADAPEVTP